MDREKALERIKKLLNHAKGDGERYSQAEVETYMKHAQKLMREFDIEEHEALGQGDKNAEEAAYATVGEVMVYKRFKLDEFMKGIARAVAKLCDVELIYRKFRFPNAEWVVFIGLPVDREVAQQMFGELLTMGRLMCKMRYGDARPREYVPYMEGFANMLQYRVIEMRRASTMANTTAIVLAKDRLAKRWVEENITFTQQKRRGGGPRVDRSRQAGYGNGVLDADKVELNDPHAVPNTERLNG